MSSVLLPSRDDIVVPESVAGPGRRDFIRVSPALRELSDAQIVRGIRSGRLGVREGDLIPRVAGGVQANDGVVVSPDGSGANVATHLVSSKEYQVVMQADHTGNIYGSRERWLAWFTPTTNAASREVAELMNTDASNIVRVHGIWIVPTLTAITGVQIGFDVNQITAVGTTGSTAMTPRAMDSTQTALPAGVTARFGSTAGATLGFLYFQVYMFNEETVASTGLAAYYNLLPLIGYETAELVLRQNQGIQVKQSVTATVGLTGALIFFTIATS